MESTLSVVVPHTPQPPDVSPALSAKRNEETMFSARMLSKVAGPARASATRAAVAAPKRGMAGGAAPKYTGWEAKVREKLPRDEQVVVAIVCFYVGLYGLSKGVSALISSPEKPEPAPAAPPATTSTDIPSGSGDDFWQWLEGPGNIEKYLATIDAAE